LTSIARAFSDPLKENRQFSSHRLKRNPLGRSPLRFDNRRCARGDVLEQLESDSLELRRGPAFSAKIGKREPLNRAIATNANRPAKKRVTRHLSRDATAIELEDDFVLRNLA
jgi:hypothetical protein